MTRRVASAVVAWCLVVAAGIVAVWLVISRVGDEVTDPSAMVVESTGTVLAPTGPASGSHTGHPSRSHRPKPSATRSGGSTPSAPPTTPTTPSSPASSAPAPDPARSSTWQGSAGLVRVTCRGSRISLDGGSPNPGWQISIGSRGPQAVDVQFERREGERKTQVRAVCSGGAPRFTVHNTGEGDR